MKGSDIEPFSILWVNPSFLDYRVVLFDELNKLSGNNLWVVYSKNRVPERVQEKMTDRLGSHAIALPGERYLKLGVDDSGFGNRNILLPYQVGLVKSLLRIKSDVIISEGFF